MGCQESQEQGWLTGWQTTEPVLDIISLQVRTLRGHSNWVKNIEYESRESLLVTSGFDGAIYTWDINQYQESQAEFKKGEISALFYLQNLIFYS